MKRIFLYILSCALVLALAGCAWELPVTTRSTASTAPADHIHRSDSWQVVRPLSCTRDEISRGICADCGEYVQQITAKAPGSHRFREELCDLCGMHLATDLEFLLNEDGESYRVVGMGTCRSGYIVVPESYNGKPVTAIGAAAFFGQKELEFVELPETVKKIGNAAFSDTLRLHTVLLPDSVETLEEQSFAVCNGMKQIFLPAGVKTLANNALASDGVLEAIYVDVRNQDFTDVEGVLFTKDLQTLVSYPAARVGESYRVPEGVRTIGPNAFQRNVHLKTVKLPDTLERIEDHGFYLCRELRTIEIPASVKTIGDYCFTKCLYLEELVLHEGLQTIGRAAFDNCMSIMYLTVPDSVTELGDFAFSNCIAMRDLDIGSGIKVLPQGLFLCSDKLRRLSLPAGLTAISARALEECWGLDEIRFGGTMEQWLALETAEGYNANTGHYRILCTDGTLEKT